MTTLVIRFNRSAHFSSPRSWPTRMRPFARARLPALRNHVISPPLQQQLTQTFGPRVDLTIEPPPDVDDED